MSYIGKGVEVVTFNTATTLDVAGNITVGGTVDGRDVATDGTKLDTITSGAIADIVQDTTPQLGGNLDLNTSNVIGTGNINVTGSITGTSFVSTGNMSFTNNSKAIFGTSPSLEIYHDGSNSILDDVGAGNFKMQLAGADKLEITSTGVDVTGTVTADGLTVDAGDQIKFGGAFDYIAHDSSNNAGIINHRNTIKVNVDANNDSSTDGYFGVGRDGTDASSTDMFRIAQNGDISFYDDTGVTQGLFWDASTQRLGLGTTGPRASALDLGAGTGDGTLSNTPSDYQLILEANASDTGDIGRSIGWATGANNVSAAISSYDAGTGITNGLVFATANNGTLAERLRIDNNGNVGIGTSPSQKLSILTTNGLLNIANGNTSNGTKIQTFTTAGNANGYLAIEGFDTEYMRIDTSGNVGIGTSSPSSYTANGNNLVILDTNVGMTLASNSTTGSGAIYFADGTAGTEPYRGIINYLHSSDSMGFSTGSTERMRISSSGNLLVGTTNETGDGQGIELRGDLENGGLVQIKKSSSSVSGNRFMMFARDGTVIGSVSMSGTTAVAYNTSSDYRLKENVVADWDATTRLKQLNPVRFNFIADPDTTVDGFLAHEVQTVVPEAITGEKDAMRDEEYEVTPAVLDDDGNEVTPAVMGTRSVPDYQGIDQSKLVPLLVKTILELEARITALETA